MQWVKYEYPPEMKMTWNTWFLLSEDGQTRLGRITQVDPTMDVFDADAFKHDGVHRGKGHSGSVALGRLTDFGTAKSVVESFVAAARKPEVKP